MHKQIKHRIAGTAAALLVLSLALGGCAAQGKAEADKENTAVKAPVLVKVQAVENGKFTDQVTISGNASPFEIAEVSAKVGGDIVFLGPDLGANVKKGQVLARIDASRYALYREKAALGVGASQLTLEEQKKDLDRNQELYNQQAISKKEYEGAVNGYKQTEISYKMIQNDMRQAELNLQDTAITAPISGMVSARKVNSGESVNPGAPIYSLVDLSQVYVETGVAEEAVNAVKQGMKVSMTFPALGGMAVDGTVEAVSPVQNDSKLYAIRILVPNKDGKIKAGMFASGQITVGNGIDGIGVPKVAVLHNEGKDYVFILQNGKALRRDINVGLGNEAFFQVKQGLAVGDKVIVVGHEKLNDGDAVKIGN